MSTRNVAFGRQIKEWRAERSLTQTQAGERMGVGQTTVAQWESRGIEWDPAKLSRIDDAFGLPPGTAKDAYVNSSDEDRQVSDLHDQVQADRRRIEELEKKVQDLMGRLSQ